MNFLIFPLVLSSFSFISHLFVIYFSYCQLLYFITFVCLLFFHIFLYFSAFLYLFVFSFRHLLFCNKLQVMIPFKFSSIRLGQFANSCFTIHRKLSLWSEENPHSNLIVNFLWHIVSAGVVNLKTINLALAF